MILLGALPSLDGIRQVLLTKGFGKCGYRVPLALGQFP
jgi:hypothetical protein